ncbi:MAG: DUF4445 domain-containing protein [Lachnospiraceae bacterium]|nr:DUF4445 domain-containing protein [Lachnospiraceae bacterium]
METCRIEFVNQNVTVEAKRGKTLLEVEIEAGFMPDAPCGGKGTCGKCKVKANGKTVSACQCLIQEDMTVVMKEKEKGEQILLFGASRPVEFWPGIIPYEVERPLLAAVDLGSTSIVAYLLDGENGKLLGTRSMLNPQRQYGADVVMRSSYALENGAEALSSCAREAVNTLLREAACESGRSREEIVRVVMVGNTCMHHLFLEIPTDTLVLAPYEPKVKEAVAMRADQCGLMVHPAARLLWLPNIGGFVGADTVGCMLAAGFDELDELTLLVDIGTNGEMVLGDRRGMTACSTAAGPAFEGAKITCGMRGGEGAIDHVWLEGEKLKYHVIGGVEPVGICGSGLLDAAACFLKMGFMDSSGKLSETWYFTPKVFINQKDMRELQLAKAAIAAGIYLLCRHRGVSLDEIKKVQLAGAFGNYLNPASACAIGLVPRELEERICSVGNAAGMGAQIAAVNTDEFERGKKLAARTEFLELAMDPEFQDAYVDELEFPEGGED